MTQKIVVAVCSRRGAGGRGTGSTLVDYDPMNSAEAKYT